MWPQIYLYSAFVPKSFFLPQVSDFGAGAEAKELVQRKIRSCGHIAQVEDSDVVIGSSGINRDPRTKRSIFKRLMASVAMLIDREDFVISN
jgi:hypothetical protein